MIISLQPMRSLYTEAKANDTSISAALLVDRLLGSQLIELRKSFNSDDKDASVSYTHLTLPTKA